MRIISGKYKGFNVRCPPGEIRPMMSRMRESMFSILGNGMNGKKFLDLFSGSGIMALEAASRGSSEIWLVDNDRKKSRILHANLSIIKDIPVKILLIDVWSFIKKTTQSFGYIHLDPPFSFNHKEKLLHFLGSGSILDESSTITLHYPKHEKFYYGIGNLVCYDTRVYGQSCLAFYYKRTKI